MLGEISTIQILRQYHSNGRKSRGTKEPLDEVKEESEHIGLKLNIKKKTKHGTGPLTSWEIKGEKLWRRKCLLIPVFTSGEPHVQRYQVGYSPRYCKESDIT